MINKLLRINKYNYFASIMLFIHYIFGDGSPIRVSIVDDDVTKKWYANYLAMGEFDYNCGIKIYGFDDDTWLSNIGISFYIIWEIRKDGVV